LKNLLQPGDVVIGISGSGQSPNVVRALEYAHRNGAKTIGFTGARASAQVLARHCDLCLRTPLTMMEQIEDVHVICHHMITVELRRRIADWSVLSVTHGERLSLAGE
jgi:D-sedoheptulose 7-phosphate isomerase